MTQPGEPFSGLNPAPPGRSQIPARSLAVAKEWALVLISQGIESTLLRGDGAEKWFLEINAAESSRAFQALKLYHLENRKPGWKEVVLGADPKFDWACLGWAGVCTLVFWLNIRDARWENVGRMDSAKVVSGQYWRMVTAMFLHADAGHLAENLGVGILLMGLVMGLMGRFAGLLCALLAGLAGNSLSLALNPKPFTGLGASGVVMGCLGLLATASMGALVRQSGGWKLLGIRNALAGAMFLFVLFGLSPGTDVFAHFGGFVAGLLLGMPFGFLPERVRSSKWLGAFSFCAVLGMVAVAWWLAWHFVQPGA